MTFEKEAIVTALYIFGVCLMAIAIIGMFIDWTFSGGAFRVAIVGFIFYKGAQYYQNKWSKQ